MKELFLNCQEALENFWIRDNDDEQGVIYPHRDALVVRAIIARNALSHMLCIMTALLIYYLKVLLTKCGADHPWVLMAEPFYSCSDP